MAIETVVVGSDVSPSMCVTKWNMLVEVAASVLIRLLVAVCSLFARMSEMGVSCT